MTMNGRDSGAGSGSGPGARSNEEDRADTRQQGPERDYDHEVRHPPNDGTSPAVTVATALGAVLDESPMDLSPPLEAVVDTNVLSVHINGEADNGDNAGDSDGDPLRFEYKDCTVHVHSDGRIGIETEERPDPRRTVPERIQRLVDDRYIPGTGREQDQRRRAILASYLFLRNRGNARRSDFIERIYPRYPGGYDIPHGGWWETIVKPGLGACPDVAKGSSMWYYVGD